MPNCEQQIAKVCVLIEAIRALARAPGFEQSALLGLLETIVCLFACDKLAYYWIEHYWFLQIREPVRPHRIKMIERGFAWLCLIEMPSYSSAEPKRSDYRLLLSCTWWSIVTTQHPA